MDRLDGKTAIVTGAARGMGAAEVRLFAEEGARVIAGDVDATMVRVLAGQVNADIGSEVVVPTTLDVSRQDDWSSALAKAEALWGGVDVLVNNAGVVVLADAVDTTEEEWERVIGVNQKGTWLGMKTVVPSMRRRGGGSIINVSSIGGLVGTSGFAAYHASKGAVRMLAKHGAIAFGPDNIRCNTIYPGPVLTPMLEFLVPTEEGMTANAQGNPLKRVADPREIATAVLFLASDDASFVTGADLAVDGGFSAQ